MKNSARRLSGHFRFSRARSVPYAEFLLVRDVTFFYPQHIHNVHSVGVMLKGIEHVITRDRTYVAGPGDVLLINADEPHANFSARATYCVVKVVPEVLRDLAREIANEQFPAAPFRTPVSNDAVLARSICHVWRALEDSASDLESSFLAMVAVLFDRQLGVPPRDINIARRPVAAARAYLREHFADDVSVARLAQIANLSVFHLLRTFHNQIGLSPHEYQLQLRVGAARKLLRTDHAIADVAAQTGFCDQSHFSRHFKRIVGMTPGEYARNSKIVQDAHVDRALTNRV